MDKLEELEMKIKELSEEIEQLKAEEENGVWKPKNGEWYWFISQSGGQKETLWYDDEVGEIRYKLGNVFKTKEEAEFRAEQLKVEAELRRFARPFVEGNYNFQLTYSNLSHNVAIGSCKYMQLTNMYFPSEEIAQKAIETVGEQRIKKYYFGVEE
mgnify:CR=1 FL=1